MSWFSELHGFRWYGERLGRLFPARDPRVLAARRTLTEIRLGSDGAELYRKQMLAKPLDPTVLIARQETLPALMPLLKRGEKFILSLSDTRCFTHEMSMPTAALSDAERILDIETSRLTPFEKADVYRIWYAEPRADGKSQLLRHAVVKKSTIRDVVGYGRGTDARLTAVAIRPDGLPAWPSLIDQTGQPYGSARQSFWKKLAVGLVIVALGLAGALYWVALSRLDQVNQAFTSGIEELDGKAKAVREKIEGITAGNLQTKALSDLRQSSVSVAKIWDELTRITPDTAWLQSLNITDNQIQIDGLATDAEAMISTLEASKSFKNVRFASPVFKNQSDNKQRFAIVLEFEVPQ